MPTDWNDMEEHLLINERRTRNVEYHALKNGRPKRAFWDRMAQRINNQYGTTFTGDQCHNKFLNLTRSYYVSNLRMKSYMTVI